MPYTIEFAPSAAKELEKLDRPVQVKIATKIDSLADNPRPHGVEKLTNEDGKLRVRVGDYRIVYLVEDKMLLILVVRIGHRKEIYKKR